MEKRGVNHIFVGAFMIAGITALIFVLFKIGGGRGVFSTKYQIKGRFTHVKGLNFGSEVSLMGFRIGTVSKVDIGEIGNKELIITMDIATEMMDRIREDSVATIKTSGVLGDKYIEVSIGSPDSPPLKADSFIKTEEPADLFAKTGNLMQDVAKYFDKGSNFDALIQHLNELSANLSTMSKDIKQEKGLINELVYGNSGARLNRSMAHLEGILRKVDSGEGTLGALVNDPTVYEDLKSLMGGAKRSTVLKYFMKQFIESGSEADKKK